MNRLWTPWRMDYIKSDRNPVMGCVFCLDDDADDEAEHIIARSRHVYVILNRYPYNNGHLMVVPYAHIDSQEALDTDALTDLMVTVNRALAVLRAAYDPPAFNLGANIGAEAGAGIARHYHFHIVPRWPGDANFMTTVGETRVIPDTLVNSAHELREMWRQVHSAD